MLDLPAETLMCGGAVLASDCPTGSPELLRDGRNGYPVRDCGLDSRGDAGEAALDRPIPPEIAAKAIGLPHQPAVLDRRVAIWGVD